MNDPLYGNKVASAVLVALLLIFGLPLLAESFFGGGSHGGGHGDDHHGDEAHAETFPQFPIEIQLASAGGDDKKPVVDLGALMAATDAGKGERAALVCKSCHTFDKGGNHLQGPNLWNVVGRPVASADGFGSYTTALKDAGGEWTYERLNEFLKNSQAYIPGGGMVQKIRKDDKRAAILAYLASLSDNPVPFPAPLAEADAAEDASE